MILIGRGLDFRRLIRRLIGRTGQKESNLVKLCGCQGADKTRSPIPVVITKGSHLFPYRTQKLSPSVPMVLGWRRPGRVGRCRIPYRSAAKAAERISLTGSRSLNLRDCPQDRSLVSADLTSDETSAAGGRQRFARIPYRSAAEAAERIFFLTRDG